MGYIYIFATVLCTVYGQLMLKWRVETLQPQFSLHPLKEAGRLLLDIGVVSGFAAAFIASFFWMAAMTRFELSYAYPFMALNFILVFICSYFIFGDSINILRMLGLLCIVLGVCITAYSLR